MPPALFTSRYTNPRVADLVNGGQLVAVGITRGAPRWKLGYTVASRMMALAPSTVTFGKREDREAFAASMRRDLDRHDPHQLAAALQGFGHDVVMLCFEDLRQDGMWCHRRMVADWFLDSIGLDVPELDDPSTPTKPRAARRVARPDGNPALGQPGLPGLFEGTTNLAELVESNTHPGLFYAVRFTRTGELYCHCKGYLSRRRCSHVASVTERLSELRRAG